MAGHPALLASIALVYPRMSVGIPPSGTLYRQLSGLYQLHIGIILFLSDHTPQDGMVELLEKRNQAVRGFLDSGRRDGGVECRHTHLPEVLRIAWKALVLRGLLAEPLDRLVADSDSDERGM